MSPVKITYSRVKANGRRYWYASAALKRLGFRDTPCGKEGPQAQARALRLTEKAVLALETGDTRLAKPSYKPGSVGHMIAAYEASAVFKRKGRANRQQLEASHKVITQHIGDTRLNELTEEHVIGFYDTAEAENGPYARWHALKALKRLLQRAADRKVITFNPASEVTNPQPQGRSQIWTAAEIRKLIESAAGLEYTAMGLCLELMDYCGFAPVDARTIAPSMLFRIGPICVIDRARAKTGETGIWVIPEDLYTRIDAYVRGLGVAILPDAPIFRRHMKSKTTGQPLPWRNQQEFSRDFRDVREQAFGKAEARRAMDIRRTVSVDTDLAGMSKEARAAMLANSMDRNAALHKVYTPETIEAAVKAFEKRLEGREMRTEQDAAMEFSIKHPSGDGISGAR